MNKILLAALAASAVAGAASAAPYTDTIQTPTNYFVPTAGQVYDSPYYRSAGQDWGWTHNAIAGVITSAELNISAFDVDAGGYGYEVDNIYALDSGTWVLLGALAGASDVFSFTNFVLGANFYDDIATGLQVKMDIDADNFGWVVTLSKSSLSIDGGRLPNPNPGGGVPEPATWALMIAGFGLAGAGLRRRRAVAA